MTFGDHVIVRLHKIEPIYIHTFLLSHTAMLVKCLVLLYILIVDVSFVIYVIHILLDLRRILFRVEPL